MQKGIPMRPSVTFATLFGLAVCASVPAKANFIDDYLAAKRYCGPLFPNPTALLTPSAGTLFGKSPADWSDADVAHLPDALKRCARIARERGVQVDLGGTNAETLSDRDYQIFVALIAQAKAERSVEEEEHSASKRADVEDREHAANKLMRDRQEAEERFKLAENDRIAAKRESDDRAKKDDADIAAAHARREAAIAHQRALAMDAEAKTAAAEAEQAEANDRQAIAGAETAAQRPSTNPRASQGQAHQANGPIQISGRTPCSYVVEVYDREDRENAQKIGAIIDQIMALRDQAYVSQGQSSVLQPLSEEGRGTVGVMPVEFCRKHPASTLERQTIDAYDGVRGMNKAMGTIP